ncbi:stage II sporulation protein M [Natranaerovirga hydrolytica]|uniref:Stage II sporulation protein M n=1 Tax=Natranaerovirga hydrolytica TaxID=680378 RepID=A0A4R1MXI0_9FIRM|nr:stage II sporulation protein M [Natranaerovirga hydrolytica]TCK97967.1 stage II sporulation protein M [Natranaerovirga hydrolytica]
MRKKIEKLNVSVNRNITFLMLFIIGIVIGSLFANYLDPNQRNELSFINNHFISEYNYWALNYIELFKHILLSRLKIIMYIWFFGLTFFGIPLIIVFILYFGISFGFVISLGTLMYEGKGLLLNIFYFLPHYMVYVPVFLFLIHKSFELCAILYFKKLALIKSYRVNQKQLFIEYMLVLLVCILLVVIGTLLETFVNPHMVRWIIEKLSF